MRVVPYLYVLVLLFLNKYSIDCTLMERHAQSNSRKETEYNIFTITVTLPKFKLLFFSFHRFRIFKCIFVYCCVMYLLYINGKSGVASFRLNANDKIYTTAFFEFKYVFCVVSHKNIYYSTRVGTHFV